MSSEPNNQNVNPMANLGTETCNVDTLSQNVNPTANLGTETCNVDTLKKQRAWVGGINRAMMGVIERENQPLAAHELALAAFESMKLSYEILDQRPIMSKVELITMERNENLKVYSDAKKELFEKYTGKYVVIAKGEIQAIGESFDDVKNVSMDVNHRFIFKVEAKEEDRGRFRWPLKMK